MSPDAAFFLTISLRVGTRPTTDTQLPEVPFSHLPFVELLERALQTRSLLEVLRRAEDEVEKPELDCIFFEDLELWFGRFREVKFTDPDRAPERGRVAHRFRRRVIWRVLGLKAAGHQQR